MPKNFTFNLGAVGNAPLSVDLLKLVDTRMLVQANSGGGKSWLLRLIAERVAGHVQLIILDPEGEFATLREKLDLALVDGGGEIATDVRTAAMLARKLVEFRISAIVDLYELRLPDRREYVRLFLESLMSVPRAHWHPIIVMIDEAHLFAPERSAGESVATQAVIALMSQGRKRGFCGVLSTQRLSKLHKDAAAESNNVVIGRTWLDVDQQRAGDLLGMDKARRQSLRDLDPGEFYAFGPAFSVSGVVRFRSDKVSTSHPKAGQRHEVTAPPASASIQELVKQLGDIPKAAQEEARSIDELRAENTRLKRELHARPVQLKPEVQRIVERIEVPVISEQQIARLEASLAQISALDKSYAASTNEFGKSLLDAYAAVSMAIRLARQPATVRPAALVPVAAPARPAARANSQSAATAMVTAPSETSAEGLGLSRPQQRILDALAWLGGLGVATADRNQVGLLSEASPTSSAYGNNLGTLRTSGLITYPSPGSLALTAAGRGVAKPPEIPPTTEALQDAVLRLLPAAKARILKALLDAYPESRTKAEVALLAGASATSSAFGNNLGSLRTLGLISYPTPGTAQASPILFLEER
jgi:uncharacterized protein